MIIDSLENLQCYTTLHKNFNLVLNFIKSHNLAEMDCGRYELKTDDVFLNLQEYQTKPIQKLEAHKKYIDIQLVISGEELMGYTNINNTSVIEAYNENLDVMFLSADVNKLIANPDNFLIFFPQDAHMPALSIHKPKLVKKAIFKILL